MKPEQIKVTCQATMKEDCEEKNCPSKFGCRYYDLIQAGFKACADGVDKQPVESFKGGKLRLMSETWWQNFKKENGIVPNIEKE